MTPKHIADRLLKSGLCHCPDFLAKPDVRAIREDLFSIYKAGGFKRAGTGKGDSRVGGDLVRRDEVHWLERETGNRTQLRLWRKIDSLKKAFNRTLFLGLKDFEGHYAVYPEHGFYARHKDRFRSDSRRTVSFILYLNKNWRVRDGGRLRVYGDGFETDISPHGGTMVCFLSNDSEHEVLLNHAPRLSFSGWFRT